MPAPLIGHSITITMKAYQEEKNSNKFHNYICPQLFSFIYMSHVTYKYYLFQTRAFDRRLPVSVFERWCWVFHR